MRVVGRIPPHIIGKRPAGPVCLLVLALLVKDLQLELTVAVSEPKRGQRRGSLLLREVLLKLLRVKYLVDADSKVSCQPPHIAAQAPVKHFHDLLVFKYVGPQRGPDLVFGECQCVDQVSSIFVIVFSV